MSTDGELYERDPEAWNAYLAEGNAKQEGNRCAGSPGNRPGTVSAGRLRLNRHETMDLTGGCRG